MPVSRPVASSEAERIVGCDGALDWNSFSFQHKAVRAEGTAKVPVHDWRNGVMAQRHIAQSALLVQRDATPCPISYHQHTTVSTYPRAFFS